MLTLIVIGLCLYLLGFTKTLAVYLGIALTVASLVLQLVAGAGFSYLFWPESVRAFDVGGFWASAYVSRAGFELWEAPAVPVIFLFDLLRVAFRLATQLPNPFTIGFFLFWLYCTNLLWGLVLRVVLPGIGRAQAPHR